MNKRFPHGPTLMQGMLLCLCRKKEEEEFKARVARQLQEQQEAEVDPEKVLEESRKRREAILAKYRQQKAAQGASQAPAGDKSRFAPTQAADPGAAGTANGAVVADGTMPRHASSQPVAALLAPAADTNMTDAETSAPAKENGQSLASGQLDAASYRETASDVGKVRRRNSICRASYGAGGFEVSFEASASCDRFA